MNFDNKAYVAIPIGTKMMFIIIVAFINRDNKVIV